MSSFFVILFLAALVLTIKPRWVFKSGKIGRKHTVIAALVMFILIGVTAPKNEDKPLSSAENERTGSERFSS